MVKNLSQLIGKKGIIRLSGLLIEVEIEDVKNSYGKNRYLVSPLAGGGRIWVESISDVNLTPVILSA